MKRLACTVLVLWAASATGPPATASPVGAWLGESAGQASRAWDLPHPAVVRVVAPGRNSISCGSGALVGVNRTQGLVVTNWHVVSEAAGPVTVIFPDGFRSGATVLRVDRDWDLAALAIWRPGAEPIRLATEAPRPGEPLTIAGYGSGSYRAVAGRCTQYVSPGGRQPFEMVELSAGARQGDSGGPILNTRGELAGVLFGTASGRTTGSYCGRVRWFLSPYVGDFPQLGPGGTMLAQQPAEDPQPSTAAGQDAQLPIAAIAIRPSDTAAPAQPALQPATSESGWRGAPAASDTRGTIASPGATPAVGPAEPDAPRRFEQIKTILAGIGALAILFHGLRLVSLIGHEGSP